MKHLRLMYRPLGFLLALTLMLSLALVGLPRAEAQDGSCPLSQEECDLLAGALISFDDVASVNIDSLHLEMSISAPDMTGPASFSFNGSGPLVLLDSGVAPFETDLTLDMSSEDPDTGESQSLSGARLLIKDDYGYFYDPEADEWQGAALDAEDFDEGDFGDVPTVEDLEELLAVLLEADPTGSDIVVWQRLDDVERGGETLAVYSLDIKLGSLLISDVTLQSLSELAAESGDEDAQAMMGMLGPMLGMFAGQLDEGTFEIQLQVSENDGRLYGFTFILDQTVDLSMLTGDPEGGPISIALTFELLMSGYNQDYEITAPEDFVEVDEINLDGLPMGAMPAEDMME